MGTADGGKSLPPWLAVQGYDPESAAKQMGEALSQWFSPAFDIKNAAPLPQSQRFIRLFAGIVSLADWIGSAQAYFPYSTAYDASYITEAKKRAALALEAFGFTNKAQNARASSPAQFCDLTGYSHPNSAQAAIDTLSPEHRLVILEAETGSGKTEAALLRFVRLWEEGKVESLFFAVPTRSAAVQLHKRVQTLATNFFKDHAPQVILAVPGYFRAGDATGQALPGYRVLWDDEKNSSPDHIARRWAAENSKRYLAAQIAVGTIDQAMLAALPVKHSQLRSASLAKSLLVIDEVHASDRYMTEIQKELLDLHCGVGGHAMLMSATLGERARRHWLDQPEKPLQEAIDAPYPAIWTGDGGHISPQSGPNSHPQKQISLSLQATKTATDCLDAAITAAEKGGKVLIIRNTVALAVETMKALESRLQDPSVLLSLNGIPTLHHGRFAPSDRILLDKAVEQAMGKERPAGGKILVGTQTLEQSLDIDADFLMTDLCPMDVLLQRLGRLYRHANRTSRPLDGPQCLVLEPQDGLASCVSGTKPSMINGLGAFEKDGSLAGIYTDLVTILATRQLIKSYPIWNIPKMNRFLVEQATHPQAHEALLDALDDNESWRHYNNTMFGTLSAQAQHARLLRTDTDTPYHKINYPDDEAIRTRLGGEGITLVFDDPPQGPFGKNIRQLILPEHWSQGLDPMASPLITNTGCNECLQFTFSGQKFRYGRYGLEKDITE